MDSLGRPTFSQHFSTQVSNHYIQLDPVYYGCATARANERAAENNYYIESWTLGIESGICTFKILLLVFKYLSKQLQFRVK